MRNLYIILASAVATIAFNIYANAAPLFGNNTQTISAEYEVLFTPAGLTFAIWGLIYIGLISFSVYPLIVTKGGSQSLNKLTPWFVLASAANIVWLVLWHSKNIELSVFAMIVLLISLIRIYRLLKIGDHAHSLQRTIFMNSPISLYLGWISVATIANVAIVLDLLEWDRFGQTPETWTMIMLIVAAVLAAVMLIQRKDFVFPMVVLWAFYGIYTARQGIEMIETGLVIGVGIILVAFGIAVGRAGLRFFGK